MPVIATDSQRAICEVYWVRLKEHCDISLEGYVGITTQGLKKRYRGHQHSVKKGSTLAVHNAMRKYGDRIIVSTVLVGSLSYCLEIEKLLRPSPKIGWNLGTGGERHMVGWKHSDETRKKISQNNGSRGRTYSEEERKARSERSRKQTHTPETKAYLSRLAVDRFTSDKSQLRAAQLKAVEKNKSMSPWQKSNSDHSVWLIADKLYDVFAEDMTTSSFFLGKKVDIPHSKLLCIVKKFKSGWIPKECPDWINFKLTSNKE